MTSYLITGGTGFIGSHLSEALLAQGHSVTVIDNLSTGRFDNIAHLVGHPKFRFVVDSITNEMVLDRLASECDVIFHLAAAVGVKLIVEHPVHTIETNIMGTEAVLKAALRYRAKVMMASTSEVYGKGSNCLLPKKMMWCWDQPRVAVGLMPHRRWSMSFWHWPITMKRNCRLSIFRLFNTVGPTPNRAIWHGGAALYSTGAAQPADHGLW